MSKPSTKRRRPLSGGDAFTIFVFVMVIAASIVGAFWLLSNRVYAGGIDDFWIGSGAAIVSIWAGGVINHILQKEDEI